MTTRIRVTPAFVDKFDQALVRLEEQASLYLTREHPEYHEATTRRVRRIPRQMAVEEFLEELRDDLLRTLYNELDLRLVIACMDANRRQDELFIEEWKKSRLVLDKDSRPT
jgi:hypothetical protein